MTTSEHYALSKPDGDDLVDIAVLNQNTDKIDAALKGLADGKADLDQSGKVPAGQIPDMGHAPAYTCGTAELTAGTSPLASGVMYLQYE